MNQKVQERLAESLTAQSTDIIPYLPCLLQDFWSLSSDPDETISQQAKYEDLQDDTSATLWLLQKSNAV